MNDERPKKIVYVLDEGWITLGSHGHVRGFVSLDEAIHSMTVTPATREDSAPLTTG